MRSKLIRRIFNEMCLFNNLVNKNSSKTLIVVFISIMTANLCFSFGNSLYTLFIGVLIYIILSVVTLIRFLISKEDIKMDFSLYNVPKEGDIIVFNDDITDELIETDTRYWIKCYRNCGREFIIHSIKYTKYDVILYLEKENDLMGGLIKISYMDTHKQWSEKSEIRDRKLNNILKI